MALRILPIIILCCFSSFAYSQTSNFVSASQSSHSTSISADWTIGELITEGFSSSNLNISHGLNETGVLFIITGDIQETESISQVYPIPFQSEFFIETNDENLKEYPFTLYDASGKSIETQVEFTSLKRARIDATTLSPGFYILTLKTNTSLKTFKLIKQ